MIIFSHTSAAGPEARQPGALCSQALQFDSLKFGFPGIRARYRDRPGRRLRFIDPFSCELVDFGTPLRYENWLLRRFDPAAVYLDASEDAFEVLHRGKQLTFRPHLHWAELLNKGVLEFVVEPGRGLASEDVERLEVVARAHGLSSSLRPASEIRRDTKLLDFLDRTRQMLVMHLSSMRNEDVQCAVLELVNGRECLTRADLLSALVQEGDGLSEAGIDAVLFWLRQSGALEFDIEGGRYGDHTAISST